MLLFLCTFHRFYQARLQGRVLKAFYVSLSEDLRTDTGHGPTPLQVFARIKFVQRYASRSQPKFTEDQWKALAEFGDRRFAVALESSHA